MVTNEQLMCYELKATWDTLLYVALVIFSKNTINGIHKTLCMCFSHLCACYYQNPGAVSYFCPRVKYLGGFIR